MNAERRFDPDRPSPRLVTLGRLALGDASLRRPKPLLLLAYLCLEGPKPRRHLSELFFPTAHDPRDALSTALTRLRRADPDAVDGDDVEVWSVVTCDAVGVLRALDAGLRTDAIRAYAGPFLSSLDLSLPPELEEWVYATREYLADRVRDAAIDEVAASSPGEPGFEAMVDAAITLAVQPDPQAEPLGRLAAVLSHHGHDEARRLHALAARYGFDLSEALPVGTPASSLGPEPQGPMIGRDEDARRLLEALARPEVRLVTVHGPGGVGKTHLCLHVLRSPEAIARFGTRRALVATEAVTDSNAVPHAMASALGYMLPGGAAPWDALAQALSGTEALLVLDGWEMHHAATQQLAIFLRAAPGVRVLATSRERMNLPEEHVLALRGLDLPGRDLTAARASAAVRLLAAEAKRHDLAFELADADLDAANRVCRAVGGLPLGLRLAGAWVRVATLDSIAETVERDATELDQVLTERDGPGPLRAVVARTWERLGPRRRDVARRLSVFPGGFRREAAAAVAGSSIADLVALVDGAWLTARPDGRFEQHAVLRQHALAALTADPPVSRAAHRAMAGVLGRLVTRFAEAAGAASHDLLRWVTEEEANLVTCFEWAAEAHDAAALVALAEPMLWYYATEGRFREAGALFRTAAAKLPEGDPACTEACAHVLASLAWCCRYSGAVDEAAEHASTALVAARGAGAPIALVRALDTLGIVGVLQGDHAAARAHLEEGLDLAEQLGDEVRANRLREKLVYVLMALGHLDDADAVAADALRQVEDGRVAATIDAVATFVAQAYLGLARGRWTRAAEAANAGLDLARRLGYVGPQPLLGAAAALALVMLGVSGDEGRGVEGVMTARATLPDAKASGDGTATTFSHMAIAWAHRTRGDAQGALEHAGAALRAAWSAGNRLTSAWTVPLLVGLLEDTDDHDRARAIAGALLADPTAPVWIAVELAERGYLAAGPGGKLLDEHIELWVRGIAPVDQLGR